MKQRRIDSRPFTVFYDTYHAAMYVTHTHIARSYIQWAASSSQTGFLDNDKINKRQVCVISFSNFFSDAAAVDNRTMDISFVCVAAIWPNIKDIGCSEKYKNNEKIGVLWFSDFRQLFSVCFLFIFTFFNVALNITSICVDNIQLFI